MSRRDLLFRACTLGLVLLHPLAAWFAPASLWGVSQLAAWTPWAGIVWTIAALALLFWAPRQVVAPSQRLEFPTRRATVAISIAAGVCFWLLRERSHFFGDGALLIRDGGYSETVTRAPLLVRVAVGVVHLGARAGASTETSLMLLSVAAGMLAVFGALRLAAALTEDRGGRWLAATLLASGGCMMLFFGHVEYYALPAAAVIAYLWFACRRLDGAGMLWPTWLALGILLPLHLALLALAPAQLFLGWIGWRRGERTSTVAAILAAGVLAWVAARVAGSGAGTLANTIAAGFGRYLDPYFDTTTTRHAFGFFSAAHGLAVVNDLLLVAPMALAAVPAIVWGLRPHRDDPVGRFLSLASLGCVAFAILFNRELGAYRDWDILAPFGFVYLAWAAACFVRPHPGRQRAAIVVAVTGGLFHLVPWVGLQISPRATRTHVETVLQSRSQWSPHARGYMYEELAIEARQRGDEVASLRAYEAAVAASPSDARYHVGLGTRYVQRGELDRAAVEFATALRHRPDYAPAHNNLAYVLAEQGRDLETARGHAAAALAANPDNPDYLLTAARVAWRAGDRAAARAAAEKVLQVRPGDRAARSLLDTLGSAP